MRETEVGLYCNIYISPLLWKTYLWSLNEDFYTSAMLVTKYLRLDYLTIIYDQLAARFLDLLWLFSLNTDGV